jgi:putative membrane protein
MHGNLSYFVIHWGIMSLSLWVASFVFNGIRFSDTSSLLVSALLLGFANAILRPILIVFTLPLTVVTLGIFLLVINALMLMLVSGLVRGFTLSGFWTAFFASIFIALLNLAIGGILYSGGEAYWQPMNTGTGMGTGTRTWL